MKTVLSQALAAVAFAACIYAPAQTSANAAPFGQWTKISTGVRNIDEVGFRRSADGMLNVVWREDQGATSELFYVPVSTDGIVQPVQKVATGWGAISNPSLIETLDGRLQLFFGGVRGSLGEDPYNSGQLFSYTSDIARSAWTLDTGAISTNDGAYASDVISSIETAAGLNYHAWGYSSGVFFREVPGSEVTGTQDHCCGYWPNLALDPVTGNVIGAWYSNEDNVQGIFTQTVFPTLGSKTYVPNSASDGGANSLAPDQRTPITARLEGDGVYTAYCSGYPSCAQVRLFRVGDASSQVVKAAKGARFVNIAAAPGGKLWVMWTQGKKAYVTRSNSAVTEFGRVLAISRPAGTDSFFRLSGEGSLGALDVFANLSTSGENEIFAAHVEPPLEVKSSPSKLKAGKKTTVTFSVTDAGEPIENALITVGSKTAVTNAGGIATLSIKPKKQGTLKVEASKIGYTSDELKLTVK